MNFLGRQLVKVLKNENIRFSHVCGQGRNYSYKSAHSLENLYPKSSLKIFTPTFVPEDPNAKFNGFIPMEKINVTYCKASGPGGQHVNSVNTKVHLTFNVQNADWLADDIKPKLMEQEKNKINNEGNLIIKSDLTRSQQLNLADALEKLRKMIRKACQPEPTIKPETQELIRKRMIKAARQRLFVKRARSQIKQDRQSGNIDFD